MTIRPSSSPSITPGMAGSASHPTARSSTSPLIVQDTKVSGPRPSRSQEPISNRRMSLRTRLMLKARRVRTKAGLTHPPTRHLPRRAWISRIRTPPQPPTTHRMIPAKPIQSNRTMRSRRKTRKPRRTNPANDGRRRLPSDRAVMVNEHPNHHPMPSPDGRSLIYLRDRGDVHLLGSGDREGSTLA